MLFPIGLFLLFLSACVLLFKRLPLLNKKTLATAGVDQKRAAKASTIHRCVVLYTARRRWSAMTSPGRRLLPSKVNTCTAHMQTLRGLLLQCRVTTPGAVSPAAAICIYSFVFLLVSLTHGGRKRVKAEEEEKSFEKAENLGLQFPIGIFFDLARGITGCDFGVGDFFFFFLLRLASIRQIFFKRI